MGSSSVFRSFNCSVDTLSHVRSLLEKPGMLPMFQTSLATQNRSYNEGLRIRSKFISKPLLATCLNTSEANSTATFNDCVPQSSPEKTKQNSAFPSGFEVGDVAMHLKRNVEAAKKPVSNISPMIPSHIPTKPMVEIAPAFPPASLPKSFLDSTNPFKNSPLEKSSKLAALEAFRSSAHVLVSSLAVGSFRSGGIVKGKCQKR